MRMMRMADDQKTLSLGLLGMRHTDQQRADIKRIVGFLHQFPLEGTEARTRLWEMRISHTPEHQEFRLWMSAPAYQTGYHAKFWLDYDQQDEKILTRVSLDLAKDDIPKQFVSKTWTFLMSMIRGVAVLNPDALTEFGRWVEVGFQAQAG